MSVSVYYSDGSVENYTNVTDWSDDGKTMSFKGKKDGDTTAKKWKINWRFVKKIQGPE